MNWDGVLKERGFEKIGHLSRLDLEIWWSDELRIEIHVFAPPALVSIRGIKTYFVKGISEDGEIYARDLEPLHEWLQVHFSVLRVSFNYFRDVSKTLAIARIQEKRFREIGDDFDPSSAEEGLSKVRAEFERKKGEIQEKQEFRRLDSMSPLKTPSLSRMLREGEVRLRQEATVLAEEGKQLERRVGIARALLREYQKNASAVALAFSIGTEAHWIVDGDEFRDALGAVVKELQDIDRYQIRQKLCHGRLGIPIEESSDPSIDWLGVCGYASPKELERWGQPLEAIRKRIESRFIVTPCRDIVVGGSVKDQKKLVAPRVLRSFLSRLPRVQKRRSIIHSYPNRGGWLGQLLDGDEPTEEPFFYPENLKNGYASGMTRSGKTYTARVLAENAMIAGALIHVLDMSRQWTGIIHPATDEEILRRLDELGVGRERATGFDVRVFVPGNRDLDLPQDTDDLLKENAVVVLKHLSDLERCILARDILEAIYRNLTEESEELRLLLVLEECHALLPGNVAREAVEAAKDVRNLIERIAREKVKYGGCILVISQSLADFKGDARVVRDNCNTRVFMKTSDKTEQEYIERYASRETAEVVKNLRTGEAVVHGLGSPPAKVKIRPPFSAVRELTDEEIVSAMRNCQGREPRACAGLTAQEESILEVVKQFHERLKQPIPAKEIEKKLGIVGGSRQRAISNLESKGLIRTVNLRTGRGRPSKGLLPASGIVPERGESHSWG